MVVVLCEEAEGDCGHWVVAPAAVEGGEESPAFLQIWTVVTYCCVVIVLLWHC